ALGAVAFHALTGHPPWGTGSREEVTRRAASGHRPALVDVAPDLPEPVVDAVEAMLATDPLDRPDARTAGNSLLRASAVAPVGLSRVPTPLAPPPPTEVVRPQRRPAVFDEPDEENLPEWTPWRRRVVVAGAAGLAITGAIGVGVSLAGSGHAPPRQAAAPPTATTAVPISAPATDWKRVVGRLDDLRAAAFAEDDVASLAAVYAPGAPGYDTDVATLKSLAARGLHAQGFSAHVQSVRVLAATATSERLRVVDRLSGYQLVDGAGAVVGHGPARPAKAFTMQLTKVDGTWRVATISLD
ncbi:MAG: hypothetical protein JO214_20185, partial [Frankiaceae bacterium]|nr:hypothetical protein [Frankiaceae bacterium]